MRNITIPSYLKIIGCIAAGTTLQAIVDYRFSPEAQQRVAELIDREKEGGLSPRNNRSWIISSIWNIFYGWPKSAPTEPLP